MEKLIKPQNQLTLSQQLCHSFFSQKGYDPFINFHSHVAAQCTTLTYIIKGVLHPG